MPEELPRRIGRYEAVGVIGYGGVGTVYRGLDPAIGRTVAIKMLRSQSGDEQLRFMTEAHAAGRLNHPNVATLFDVGRTDGDEIYVVQEFLDGENLSRVIARHALGLKATVAVYLLAQVARALAHAHANGIVHRDIKPGNVVVSADGVAKLLDFGIARIVRAPANVTMPGTMIGTPMYMAPEAIRGETGDERGDVYSFGALAFELLTGKKPFEAETVTALMLRILQEPVPSIRKLAPGCPVQLAAVVEACLAKLPEERPSSMRAVADTLDRMPAEWDELLVPEADPSGDERVAPDAVAVGLRTITGSVPAIGPRTYSHGLPAFGPRTGTGLPADPDIGGSPGAEPLRSAALAAEAARLTPDFATPPSIRSIIAPPTPAQLQASGDLCGQTVGRFVLHERVARGQSGDLYKAWDPVRGGLVGVKVVHTRDDEAKQRLLRGGRIWIGLQHPNIVRVLEVHPDYFGQSGVIVTEMIDGINLEQLASQRNLSLEQAVWIAMQVCDGLTHIHSHGVVHREVKPRNILVSGKDLHATLLDSGIARHANPEVDAFTKTGIFVGDLAFAAPEQAEGRVDQRTDIYAVVAVLYELVAQTKLPFPLPPDWKPDSAALEGLPSRLRALIERGLRRDPKARFASIRELHDQLRAFAPDRQSVAAGQAVVALHGIRTQAAWQRAFSEVAGRAGLNARVDRWNFGYFSSLRFLMPWARLAKVRWFREMYQREFGEAGGAGRERPSIVAHSFGTYILGNALLRYPYLRFDKVLLCGSILPKSFPWDRIIERGQVQAVRNEFGSEDVWTRAVGWFVPATGPSGLEGFDAAHPRFEQERFEFAHSEYFERGHMDNRWLPYLTAQIGQRPVQDIAIAAPGAEVRPWGLYGLYVLFAIACAAAIVMLEH